MSLMDRLYHPGVFSKNIVSSVKRMENMLKLKSLKSAWMNYVISMLAKPLLVDASK